MTLDEIIPVRLNHPEGGVVVVGHLHLIGQQVALDLYDGPSILVATSTEDALLIADRTLRLEGRTVLGRLHEHDDTLMLTDLVPATGLLDGQGFPLAVIRTIIQTQWWILDRRHLALRDGGDKSTLPSIERDLGRLAVMEDAWVAQFGCVGQAF